MNNTLLLGLLGALCWGIAPVFGKLGLRDIHPVDGLVARTIVTMSFVLAWIVGAGRASRLAEIAPKDWLYLGIEAFLATLAGDLFYYLALKWGTAGGAAVALSVSPVFTVWVSSLLLHESYTWTQMIGALLVAAGILLVAVGGDV
ncbi:MAG: EamA family transporter [Firmicutes bacterium]|nr:EamA family transporter [Bacillota bacterium]